MTDSAAEARAEKAEAALREIAKHSTRHDPWHFETTQQPMSEESGE